MTNHKKIKASPVAKKTPGLRLWWASKAPFFRVGARFMGLIVIFSAISLTPFFQRVLAECVALDAKLTSKVLNGLGQATHTAGDTISSSHFAMTVFTECSASEFAIFLWTSILAFPATLRCKILGIVFGTLGVAIVNFGRLVTLFLVGVYRPRFFSHVHEELWPGLLVVAVIFFVTGWAMWAMHKEQTHASV